MKIVFKNLRKKMAYSRVVRINQRLALNKQQEEELIHYIEWAKNCNRIIAAMSAQKALCELYMKDTQLKEKRKSILQRVFGENHEEKEI